MDDSIFVLALFASFAAFPILYVLALGIMAMTARLSGNRTAHQPARRRRAF